MARKVCILRRMTCLRRLYFLLFCLAMLVGTVFICPALSPPPWPTWSLRKIESQFRLFTPSTDFNVWLGFEKFGSQRTSWGCRRATGLCSQYNVLQDYKPLQSSTVLPPIDCGLFFASVQRRLSNTKHPSHAEVYSLKLVIGMKRKSEEESEFYWSWKSSLP